MIRERAEIPLEVSDAYPTTYYERDLNAIEMSWFLLASAIVKAHNAIPRVKEPWHVEKYIVMRGDGSAEVQPKVRLGVK